MKAGRKAHDDRLFTLDEGISALANYRGAVWVFDVVGVIMILKY